jgi:hypothetical protein
MEYWNNGKRIMLKIWKDELQKKRNVRVLEWLEQ